MSPGNILKCFLLLSFMRGSPLLSLLSRPRNPLSCTACCVLPTYSPVLALSLTFLSTYLTLLTFKETLRSKCCHASMSPSGGSAFKTWKTFYYGTFTVLLTLSKLCKCQHQHSFILILISLYCSSSYYKRLDESKWLRSPFVYWEKSWQYIFWDQWAKEGCVNLSVHGSPTGLEFSAYF